MNRRELSHYRAFRSRDPRFDGRFFVGVLTTGIYCRPVCPARTPKIENVRFYPCAAACEEAGFRPCRRCRPETAPGTPAWTGSSTTVSRALRLIGEGALDRGAVPDLASRLGVGERHLRRLFTDHLGASPLAVARTRRAHFARMLIDQTALPMARIAENSGYRSVRLFNHEIVRTFGAAPRDLRQRHRGGGSPEPGVLRLRLPFRPPFDWDGFVAFLGPRALPGVEVMDREGYRRAIRTPDGIGRVDVLPAAGNYLLLEVRAPGATDLMRLVERARRLFDLSADPARIGADLGRDPRLARLVRRNAGQRIPGAWDPFELAIRAVLGQQVSVAGATTIAGRLIRAHGEPLPAEIGGGLTHLFPAPEVLARADVGRLGMPEKRAAAIRGLARAVARGELQLEAHGGHEEIVAALAEMPGLGPWTAEYIALRALGEPDAFPASDLGLRKAVSGDGAPVPAADLARRAEAWRPWRGYAALHLWSSLAAPERAGGGRRTRHGTGDRRDRIAPRAARARGG